VYSHVDSQVLQVQNKELWRGQGTDVTGLKMMYNNVSRGDFNESLAHCWHTERYDVINNVDDVI
jgi:hypothetical protein